MSLLQVNIFMRVFLVFSFYFIVRFMNYSSFFTCSTGCTRDDVVL